MIEVNKSALLNYSDKQLFDLVNDVEAYPQYLQGCIGATVFEQTPVMMRAELTLSKLGLQKSFTTCNTLIAPTKIIMALEDGPFDHFEGVWHFNALADNACKVSFNLRFNPKGRFGTKALSMLMSSVGSDMVSAMCERAKIVYG